MSGRRIVALSGGSAPHERALHLPEYRRFLSSVLYLPDLADGDLDRFDVVLLPDRSHLGRVAAAAPRLLAVLDRGATLVVLGEHPIPWLPGLRWEHRPTNYWWWLEPGASSGLVAADPDHGLFRHLTLEDATWHHHGVLLPPEGADTVIATDDGGAILYVDRVSTVGTVVAATLDPVSHVGSYFMPAAARFLRAFLPWLADAGPN